MDKHEIINDLEIIRSYSTEWQTQKNIQTLINKLNVVNNVEFIDANTGKVILKADNVVINYDKL